MNHTHLKTAFVFVPVVIMASLSVLDGCSDDSSASSTSSSGGTTSSSGTSSGASGTSGASSGTSGASSGTSGASSGTSGSSGDTDAGSDAGGDGGNNGMNFFVTSTGNGKGGDFRLNAGDADGLAGADAFCKQLATAVSPALGAKNWKAYLSTTTVSARSRIGNGPFINSKGVVVATSVQQLHDEAGNNMLSGANSLDENGNQLANNVHDILTGALANGGIGAANCNNWTSSATNVQAVVGHSNRTGGGSTSWNAVHQTGGCAPGTGAGSVGTGGGRGSIYCFAP